MENSIVKIVELNINEIIPNRFQPRRQFDEDEIMELSDSIKRYGVIQPLVVRPTGDKYEIIAGERRYKASVLAGLETVPVIIKNLTDKDSAEIAIIENIQRRNLSAIEEALSYKKVLDMGYLTQEDLAAKLGKSQPTIANKIRLLNLSDEVQEALLENKISERHARSLLRFTSTEEQNKMLERIISERLTVRKTDEEIDKIKELESGEIQMNEESGNIVPPMEAMPVTPSVDSMPSFDIFGADNTSTITQPEQTAQSEFTMPQVPAAPETPVPVVPEVTPAPQPEFVMPQVPAAPEIPVPVVPEVTPAPQPEFVMPQVPAAPETPVPVVPEVTPAPQPEFVMPQVPAAPEIPAPVVPETAPAPQPEFTMPNISPIIEQPEPPIVAPTPTVEETPQPEFTMPEIPVAPEVEPSTIEEPTVQQPIIVTDYSKQYDPVMPAASQPLPKHEFKEVIDAIRECSQKIEQYGYVIDVEEYDLANLYQVVFKVEK